MEPLYTVAFSIGEPLDPSIIAQLVPFYQGQPGLSGAAAQISLDAWNRLVSGSDQGLYVPDDLASDPLAYYILAKN